MGSDGLAAVMRHAWKFAASAALVAACASTPPLPSSGPTSTPSETFAVSSVPAATVNPTTAATTLSTAGVFPSSVLGMPVLTVAKAHELASSGKLDGRVAAVGGYWAEFAYPCPMIPHQAVLAGQCYGAQFEDDPSAISPQLGPETGAPISARETGSSQLLWGNDPQHPVPVILIVHSGDSRAWQCSPDQRKTCSSNLVIDQLAWKNGAIVELGSPNSDLPLTRLRLTPEQAGAAAAHSGDQVLTAYPLSVTDMNSVDPRFLGLQAPVPYEGALSDLIWYVRMASGPPDADGVTDATVRLIDDPSGIVLSEMPLTVAADYRPARLVIDLGDGSRSDFGNQFYPRGAINSAGTAIYSDYASLSSTPVQLTAGNYVLQGFVSNENGSDVGDQTCTTPITVEAEANLAYAVTFTKTGCSWSPTQDAF